MIPFLSRTLAAALLAATALVAHAQAPQPPEVAAKAYLLMDVTAGQVLVAKEPDAPVEPASLTIWLAAGLTAAGIDWLLRGHPQYDGRRTVLEVKPLD